MKNLLLRMVMFFCVITVFLSLAPASFAKIEWEILQNIALDDSPKDITISQDGLTAYILCSKSVKIYSVVSKNVTDSIPLKDEFSQIAISPRGEELFLTKATGNEISIVQISQVYDIPIGKSLIIGKKDAPVSLFAFLDYQ